MRFVFEPCAVSSISCLVPHKSLFSLESKSNKANPSEWERRNSSHFATWLVKFNVCGERQRCNSSIRCLYCKKKQQSMLSFAIIKCIRSSRDRRTTKKLVLRRNRYVQRVATKLHIKRILRIFVLSTSLDRFYLCIKIPLLLLHEMPKNELIGNSFILIFVLFTIH